MSIVNLPLLALILFNIGLSIFVYSQNRKALLNRTFAAFILTTSFWILSNFLIDNSRTVGNALLWTKLAFASGIIVPFWFLLFSGSFRGIVKYPIDKLRLAKTVLPIAIIVIISFTKLVVGKVSIKPDGTVEVLTGPVHILWITVFLVYIIWSIHNLFKVYKGGDSLKKLQLRYLLGGTIITVILISIVNFVLPTIEGELGKLASYTPYSLIVMESSIAYAIAKHRLLEIEVIIRRSLVYSTLLVILIGLYSLLVLGLNRIFLPAGTDTWPRFTDLIAIVVVAFTVDPLKRVIEKSTDRVFFKARYNAEETISRLSETLVSVIDLPQLVGEIKKVLHDTLKVSKIAIYTKADSHYKPLEGANDFPRKLDLSVEKEYFLATSFAAHRKEVLVLDEIKRIVQEGKKLDPELVESANFLADNGVAVIVPLLVKGNLSGAMFLGEKLSQDIYSGEDIRFLEILAHQAALALENAKLYEEERLYGIHLKQEVEKATANLRDANERLKELDKLKDEFMSIASHELRTPMTAIKSYVWLALNNRGGEIGPKLRNYLTKVYDSSERMINMINDMLNVSRIETGRLQLEILPTSIPKVLEMVVGDLSARAAEAGVEIKTTRDQIVPLVLADKNKLAEIFTNLIGNALKFTPKGGSVTVASRKVGDVVETSVTDTGIGIAKENIGKLFKKYGRLGESYATVSPSTGTGLGLYITKQYLEKMKGDIRVESTPGKGSTFTFSLPIAAGTTKEIDETSQVTAFVPKRIIR